jgi:hypothetical protein
MRREICLEEQQPLGYGKNLTPSAYPAQGELSKSCVKINVRHANSTHEPCEPTGESFNVWAV